jgi:hypothetical protein
VSCLKNTSVFSLIAEVVKQVMGNCGNYSSLQQNLSFPLNFKTVKHMQKVSGLIQIMAMTITFNKLSLAIQYLKPLRKHGHFNKRHRQTKPVQLQH